MLVKEGLAPHLPVPSRAWRNSAGLFPLDLPPAGGPLPLGLQNWQILLPVLLVYVIDMTAPTNQETPYSFDITMPGSFMDTPYGVLSINFRPG